MAANPKAASSSYEALFARPGPVAGEAHRRALEAAVLIFAQERDGVSRVFDGADPSKLESAVERLEAFPEHGRPLERVVAELGGFLARHSIDTTHPACAAHLHCPPLVAALAADAVVSATNQSMDSWDQAPAATHLEQRVIQDLCALAGLPRGADGVFTTGGTESNRMGLLLARDTWAKRELDWDVRAHGLPPDARRWRVLASEAAHFTIHQAASELGLGDRAVVPVGVDAQRKLCPRALDRALAALDADGLTPIALVATAGTTEFGSIDPLPELAQRAYERSLWLHVDASYGGALLFSHRHRAALRGLELADSVAIDFHKLLWQPISCGTFLARASDSFDLLATRAAYLNPAEDENEGIPNLCGKSLQTSRRFDALKPLMSFHALGRATIGALIDRTLELATRAAIAIDAEPRLERINDPMLTTLVFRYVPQGHPERSDRVNASIRAALLGAGEGLIGRTRISGRLYLKLSLTNPCATESETQDLLERVVARGGQAEEAA